MNHDPWVLHSSDILVLGRVCYVISVYIRNTLYQIQIKAHRQMKHVYLPSASRRGTLQKPITLNVEQEGCASPFPLDTKSAAIPDRCQPSDSAARVYLAGFSQPLQHVRCARHHTRAAPPLRNA